ncbi:MAG TPA: ABC transporter substrate-binding protein [Armatimonadaceae bacterium]|nr:ABC transporter substrate-binding protein [Armatimonadaceae bacterium]
MTRRDLLRRALATTSLPLGAAGALAAAGCGRTSGSGDGREEVVYWTGWSGNELAEQEDLVARFNREDRNVRARILTQFGQSGYQKVRIAFAGGATPDVMSTVWAEELASYALRGVLTPLDEYLARSGRDFDAEFTPGVARMLRVAGKVYGLAVTTNTSFIAYNKTLFREVGLDPDRPPRTIEELDEAAKRCTKYDANGGYLRYGLRPGGLQLWAYVFGGQWYDAASGTITANHPGNVAALDWLQSYAREYDLRKMQAFQTTFGSNETPSGPFFVGKIAMWQTGEWAQESIRRYAPKLDWGWFPLPSPADGSGRDNVTGAGGSVFVIPKACPRKEAAWGFLNWIASPGPVAQFCKAIHNVPPLIEAGRDPYFATDPLYRFCIPISQGQNAFGPPPTPIWPTFNREIGRVEEKVMLGGEDPKRALDALQRAMEKEQRMVHEDLGL